MHHSKFKVKFDIVSTWLGKCSCGQTLCFTSEKDMNMKLRMHAKFCSKPSKSFEWIGVLNKAVTLRERQLIESERTQRVHEHH